MLRKCNAYGDNSIKKNKLVLVGAFMIFLLTNTQ